MGLYNYDTMNGDVSKLYLTEANTATDYDDKIWSILYGSLVNTLGVSANKFQLIYPFTSWNWETANLGYTTGAQYDFCSTIPQWSATGAYVSSGSQFPSNYRAFLNVILANTTDPALQQQILRLGSILTQTQNDYQTTYKQAQDAYKVDVQDNNPTFTVWLTTPAGFSWNSQLAAKTVNLNQAQANYTSAVKEAKTPGLNDALTAYANQDYYTKYQDPALSSFPAVPGISISQSSTQWVTQVQGSGGTPGNFGFSNSDSTYDYKKSWAGGSGSVGNWFWAVSTGGSWQQIEKFQSDNSLKVKVSLNAWDTIGITNTGWYDSGAVAILKNGPFTRGYSAYQETGKTYMWGEGGVLPLLKTGMIVAYQPKIEITVSKSAYSSFHSQFSASTGLRIGPFTFGGSGGSTTNTWTRSVSGQTFSVESTSTIPVIIGVDIMKMPG